MIKKTISIDKSLVILILQLLIIYALFLSGKNLFMYLAFILTILFIMYNSPEQNVYLLMGLVPSYKMLMLPNGMFIFSYVIPFALAKHFIIRFKYIFKKDNLLITILLMSIIFWELLHYFIFEPNLITISIRVLFSLMYVTFMVMDTKNDLRVEMVAIFLIVGNLMMAVSGLATGEFSIVGLYQSRQVRFGGVNEDPNTFALFVATTVSAIPKIMQLLPKQRLKLTIAFVVLFVLGALSFSKGYFLCMAVVFFLFFVQTIIGKKKETIGIFIFLGVVSVIMLKLYSNDISGFYEQMSHRFNNISSINELSTGRSAIYINYLNYIADNPYFLLFGGGVYNYITYAKINIAAHNTFLELLLSWGIPGLFLTLLLILAILRCQKDKKKSTKIDILSITPVVCLFIGSMSLSLIAIETYYYYIFFAILVVFCNNQEMMVVKNSKSKLYINVSELG